jgi:hypothetical protein
MLYNKLRVCCDVVLGVFGLRGTHDGWFAKLAGDAEKTKKCAGR